MAGAFAEFQRAYALAGDNADSVRDYALALARFGRSDEALAIAARAAALDPLNVSTRSSRSRVLFWARRYAEAEAVALGLLATEPKRLGTRVILGDSLLLQGKVEAAQAEYARLSPEDPFHLVGLALSAARRGDRPGAEAELAKLQGQLGDLASYQYAQIRAQLGDIEPAFSALDRALAVRDPGLTDLHVDPFLDPLRKDPRYKALEKKLNFPAA
jgi:tetratricopeptide (TPR) repeat protein